MTPFPDTPPLLSPAEHARMLQDIARVSLAAAARADTGRAWDDLDVAPDSSAAPACPRERLGFLARALPILAQACGQIARAPITSLRSETRRAAPPARARHVSPTSLLRAVRAGHAAQWVDDTRAAPTHDTPEACAALSFLAHLRRDAGAIAALADAAELPDAAAQSRTCARQLKTLCALPLWNEATPDPEAWTRPPTERMTRHPAFSQIATLTRQYRHAFAFDWQQPLLRLPACESWQLYETWGVFQTLRALLALGATPRAGSLAEPQGLLACRQTLLTVRLAQGEMSRLDLLLPSSDGVSLFYQRAFPAGLRSLSRTLQPDICLETARGDLFLLDPKYKPYDAVGDEGGDMDQMHAYRDAIVSADGSRPVRRAWCVYAGGLGSKARPIICYGPQGASIVGALRLRPGDEAGFARLRALLGAWLGIA